jgi:translation initiation factor IF-3
MAKKKREHLLNDEIKASEVRLPEEGIIKLSEALRIAESQEMDLVLINSSSSPPVCRILNYEKFIYEQNKAKKVKNKTPELKEIKLGPNTAENDLTYRAKHIIEFLDKGHKVKVTLQFRGREMAFVDKGKALMLKLMVAVEEHGIPEGLPKMEGKKLIGFIKPKPKK